MKIRTMLQGFEWNLPADSMHWSRMEEKCAELKELGFTDVWLPPAYKGFNGAHDVGYGVYDLYDLGEFDQKGTVYTKYGSKDQYLALIDALHAKGMKVIADIVLNHKMGGDATQKMKVTKLDANSRSRVIKEHKLIEAWTMFTFPGRNGVYSDFIWTKDHITAVDYDARTGISNVFLLEEKVFSDHVSKELDNYDFLMGIDLDLNHPEVKEELTRWGKWYMDFTGIDGFRLDAVKHMDYDFYPEWLGQMREHKGEEMFAVGEYWRDTDFALYEIDGYLNDCKKCMALFDVPLHRNFYKVCNEGAAYDLRKIFDGTLVQYEPWYAVTFVDNHDTQPGQALESWISSWFKPLAYALILLREGGFPCVFYGDLYGTQAFGKDVKNDVTGEVESFPIQPVAPCTSLKKLLQIRERYAHGEQKDYFEKYNCIGWSRGDSFAVVMSNNGNDSIRMKLGRPGQMFIDLLGNDTKPVFIEKDGTAEFRTRGNSVSVWVPKE
ncbi:MAG: alpha-amylase [Oscillospiraceae bacterium]|nr:alpha-amylase [Oscillospiraceae bacterium]